MHCHSIIYNRNARHYENYVKIGRVFVINLWGSPCLLMTSFRLNLRKLSVHRREKLSIINSITKCIRIILHMKNKWKNILEKKMMTMQSKFISCSFRKWEIFESISESKREEREAVHTIWKCRFDKTGLLNCFVIKRAVFIVVYSELEKKKEREKKIDFMSRNFHESNNFVNVLVGPT